MDDRKDGLTRVRLTRVERLQSMQPLPETLGKSVICIYKIRKQGISTGLGSIQKIQIRRPWRLGLIRHITVPGYRIRSFLEELTGGGVFCTTVDEMHLWIAHGSSGCGVDVQTAEIGGMFQSSGNGNGSKVLVVEY